MEWRLIEDGPASGAWNMAVDEALLLRLAVGTGTPVLRFYQWEPACLSLGRFQKLDDGQWERLQNGCADVVRRPTGGRAVLHQHEVTYCAVFPESILPPDSRSVLEAYRWLSQGFLKGLSSLGIRADFGPAEHERRDGRPTDDRLARPRFDCFSEVARCDFAVDGRKLLGAAQFRHGGCALQHGSLLLKVERTLWSELGLTGSAVSLDELGFKGERPRVLEALKTGLGTRLGTGFRPAALDNEERQVAHSLLETKYGCQSWNREGKNAL